MIKTPLSFLDKREILSILNIVKFPGGIHEDLPMIRRQKNKYKTKDICELFDISKATLFRWESEGLISNVGRDWRNWRLYSEENVKEIKKIIYSRSGKKERRPSEG